MQTSCLHQIRTGCRNANAPTARICMVANLVRIYIFAHNSARCADLVRIQKFAHISAGCVDLVRIQKFAHISAGSEFSANSEIYSYFSRVWI